MKISTLHILTLGLFMLANCAKPVTQEDLIQTGVALRLEKWKQDQHAKCLEEALTLAEHHVDSIILVSALDTKLDTIPKPDRPIKPDKPVFKQKPDSVNVRKILPDTVNRD